MPAHGLQRILLALAHLSNLLSNLVELGVIQRVIVQLHNLFAAILVFATACQAEEFAHLAAVVASLVVITPVSRADADWQRSPLLHYVLLDEVDVLLRMTVLERILNPLVIHSALRVLGHVVEVDLMLNLLLLHEIPVGHLRMVGLLVLGLDAPFSFLVPLLDPVLQVLARVPIIRRLLELLQGVLLLLMLVVEQGDNLPQVAEVFLLLGPVLRVGDAFRLEVFLQRHDVALRHHHLGVLLLGIFRFFEFQESSSRCSFLRVVGHLRQVGSRPDELLELLLLDYLLVFVLFFACAVDDVLEVLQHGIVLDRVQEEEPQRFGLLEAPFAGFGIDAEAEIALGHFLEKAISRI